MYFHQNSILKLEIQFQTHQQRVMIYDEVNNHFEFFLIPGFGMCVST